MQKILGISAYYHDSAAALIIDGKVFAAAQEERFTRDKHTPDFPEHAIRYCLTEAGLHIDELDAVVFYDKPLLKFERLLETYYAFSPKGLISFLKAIPVWLNEKMFLKKNLKDGLKAISDYDPKKLNLLFSEHHLSHAASAFYVSPFKEAAVLTIDGVGEWNTTTLCIGKDEKIDMLKEVNFPHSLGLFYSAFTYFLGFRVNSGEYKLMGLAPYGDPDAEETKVFIELIKEKLIKVFDDGSIWLDQKYYNYSTGLTMIKEKKWEELLKISRRKADEEIVQRHCNLALAVQKVTEEVVLKLTVEAKKVSKSDNLCLAGGVALNCVANGLIERADIFKNIYIQPAAGDAGGALGAALAVHYHYFDNKRAVKSDTDSMQGSYLGPDYSAKEITLMNRRQKAVVHEITDLKALTEKVASHLAEGKVVGWFQGRMEFGPRALGNRSILGDARKRDMQKKLNLKIKYREGFRPFAPSVLAEDAKEYFALKGDSPYMLIVAPVQESRRKELPKDYFQKDLWERLYYERSDIQSVTHLDFSARVQTVHIETNPRFHSLLKEFKHQTNYSLLVNTSFNVRGEPIVCTPEDAYRCFMSTEMDFLVINDFLYVKTEQEDWENKEKWKQEFKED